MSEEYLVDKIEGRRVRSGRVEYYIKWAGYSRDENTWEPEENLIDKTLAKRFEEDLKRKRNINSTKSSQSNIPILKKIKGFERGLSPKEIIGATDVSGVLLFLMKWKNTEEMDLVSAKEANVKCPEIVINFYEKHLKFIDD